MSSPRPVHRAAVAGALCAALTASAILLALGAPQTPLRPFEPARAIAGVRPSATMPEDAGPELPQRVSVNTPPINGPIRVAARWSDGRPALGVAVYARRTRDAWWPAARTGIDGTAEIRRWEGCVYAIGHPDAVRSAAVVARRLAVGDDLGSPVTDSFAPNAATVAVQLRRGASMRGQIWERRSPDRAARLPRWWGGGLLVCARGPFGFERWTTSDAQGAFELRGLHPERDYALIVWSQGWRVSEGRTARPGAFARVVIERAHRRLRGTVTGPNGEAVDRFAVRVLELHPLGPILRSEFQGGHGWFRTGKLPVGKYEIALSTDDFAPWRAKVVVAPNERPRCDVAMTRLRR